MAAQRAAGENAWREEGNTEAEKPEEAKTGAKPAKPGEHNEKLRILLFSNPLISIKSAFSGRRVRAHRPTQKPKNQQKRKLLRCHITY
jgi:hypothetical protein